MRSVAVVIARKGRETERLMSQAKSTPTSRAISADHSRGRPNSSRPPRWRRGTTWATSKYFNGLFRTAMAADNA